MGKYNNNKNNILLLFITVLVGCLWMTNAIDSTSQLGKISENNKLDTLHTDETIKNGDHINNVYNNNQDNVNYNTQNNNKEDNQNNESTEIFNQEEKETDLNNSNEIDNNQLKDTSIRERIIDHMGETILNKLFKEETPVNFTFEFSNSTVTLPVSLIAEYLNISDVYMYSPEVELPLSFNAHNMTYNISIQSEQLPMTIHLLPSNATVPLALNIDGNNEIPVSLNINEFKVPQFNYVAYGLFGAVHIIVIVIVVFQQRTICQLKRRLDDIDVCNQVAEGHRVKVGNSWYHSVPSQDNQQQSLSPHTLLCSNCGQVNGRTKFCFNCGHGFTNNNNNNNNNISENNISILSPMSQPIN